MGTWRSAGATCARCRRVSPRPPEPSAVAVAAGSLARGTDPFSAATVSGASPGLLRCSTSVVISVKGAPTAPWGRIIRRRWIVVSWGGRVVAVRVGVIVGVREYGAKREGSEPEPDRGARADPTSAPAPASICRPRHRRQPDSGKDRRSDGQPPTSFPKEPANEHIPSLANSLQAGSEARDVRTSEELSKFHTARRSATPSG